MTDWEPRHEDLKRYPHFDKFLPLDEISRIVKDPERVRKNAFLPFLLYEQRWQPFRTEQKPKQKSRPIRYASRRDAYIFAYYRRMLSEPYEHQLRHLGIEQCPVAYRKIPEYEGSKRGKCNIHFAKDAFDRISALGNCCAVTLDISRYFESLDHGMLYGLWCRLLEVTELPENHNAVFKAITKYAVVDRDEAYERLGYIVKSSSGKKRFTVPPADMPMQLCSMKEFREKICGDSKILSNIIHRNDKEYGIPQGAPISDLLANLYLIDFDLLMNHYVNPIGGYYYRYSDDILIIVPGAEEVGRRAMTYAMDRIRNFGSQLVIKQEKVTLIQVRKEDGTLHCTPVEGRKGKNGLEYLGFRFDGKAVYLRDSTLSRFYRKIAYSARHEAIQLVARYPGKDLAFLKAKFDVDGFAQRFSRVEDFDANRDYQDWTFWTYAKRAAEVFGSMGVSILSQLKNHQRHIRRRLMRELQAAHLRTLLRQSGDST